MALRFSEICVDAHDATSLGTWWAEVLGWRHEIDADGDVVLHAPAGAGPNWIFLAVPDDKVVKNRLHLDVRAAPGLQGDERMAALEAECERLTALGAARVKRFEPEPPMSGGFIVMQDPEGNEFCLD